MKIELQRVHYMPKDLQPGILYVSDEFGIAMHLCPCGCGSKVKTPLGRTEWALKDTIKGPSLYPSVGNWQQECQSHYWIHNGEVIWAPKWTPDQIATGRKHEEERRRTYYESLDSRGGSIIRRCWRWLKNLFQP